MQIESSLGFRQISPSSASDLYSSPGSLESLIMSPSSSSDTSANSPMPSEKFCARKLKTVQSSFNVRNNTGLRSSNMRTSYSTSFLPQLVFKNHHGFNTKEATTENTDILFPPAVACSPPPIFDDHPFSIDSSLISSTHSDSDSLSDTNSSADSQYAELSGDQLKGINLLASNYPLIRKTNLKHSNIGTREHNMYRCIKVDLQTIGTDIADICSAPWSQVDKKEMRRIVRIHKSQDVNTLTLKFGVVNRDVETMEHVTDLPPDTIDISCLECPTENGNNGWVPSFYITSVEFIKIVELLVYDSSHYPSSKQRRKERGRIRSNLTHFWSEGCIDIKHNLFVPSIGGQHKADELFRCQLARRIASYTTRKPTEFDKSVRILEWSLLVPALERVIQYYWVRIPNKSSLML